MLQSTSQSFGAPTSDVAFGDGQGAEQRSLAPPILLQYWQVVLRWKWVIAGLVVASLVVGVVATLLATPQYTATTRIEISREQKNVTNVEGVEIVGDGAQSGVLPDAI